MNGQTHTVVFHGRARVEMEIGILSLLVQSEVCMVNFRSLYFELVVHRAVGEMR